MVKYSLLLGIVLALLGGCQSSSDTNGNQSSTPRFNAAASDAKAIAIADSVIKAMGGQQAWQQTPIISWTFFGRRTHTWDKQKGRDHIAIPSKNMTITFDIQSKEGTVIRNGEAITRPDSLKKHLQQAYEMWVNDSYWLVMPYKLKDPGVKLNYMGLDTTQTDIPAYKLKLTFEQVGVTPQNKYFVYVDTTDFLVRQFSYFPKAGMDKPTFTLPWKDYKQYGDILLSGNRGKYQLTNIKVLEEWPDFSSKE